MTDVCRRALVAGRVQGVWYRGSTQKQALKLGVTGWAKNRSDGRVEVIMRGSAEALDKLRAWLQEGPPMATVTSVEVMDEELHDFTSFTVG